MPPGRTYAYSGKYPHQKEDVEALKEIARAATGDFRIANYFSRGHVDATQVLNVISAERTYVKCMKTETFLAYEKKRMEVDEFGKLMSAFSANELVASKTVACDVAALWTVLIVLSESGNRPDISALAIPFTIVSALISAGAGWLLSRKIRKKSLTKAIFFLVLLIFAVSVCGVALPVTYSLFPWRPLGAYIDIVLTFCAGAAFDREAVAGTRELLVALTRGCVCLFETRKRNKARDRWLQQSLKEIIYPRVVLAINDILGKDSTKLLVEQDSDGLRRLQDPRLVTPTKSQQRLQHLLTRMDGGSIAVTGPRGAGKSTLLRQMCIPESEPSAPPSIYMSAPSEYVAREFLAELFQQICDAHLAKFDTPVAGMRYRGKRTRRDAARAVRRTRKIVRIIFRILFVVSLLTLAMWTFFAEIRLPNIEARLPFKEWYNDVAPHIDYFWSRYTIWFRFGLIILALILWPKKRARRRWKAALRHPESVRQARSYSIHLKIERTTNWGANIGLPGVRGASFSLSKGVSEQYAPWSMPEMVGRIREFLEDISDSGGCYNGPLIIGIDEIDRIGSIEQAERFIGEIKSIFGIKNCFFLVSVAEDVGFLFSRRSIVGQSTLEHSFDDVVVVETLEFGEAREMLSTRVPGFTDSFVFLALALSGGLPREMIRVARRLIDANHQETKEDFFPRIGDLALRIVSEDIAEVIRTSRSQLSRMSLPEPWGVILYRLHIAITSLRSDEVQEADRKIVIDNLCSLRLSDEISKVTNQSDDEVAAAKIIDGVVAFACYCATIIEAFDNDFFDLRAARKSLQQVTRGSYLELAAARMELGISPSSSQSIIRNFREGIGLTELL
jgi:hypothetical protein